MSNLRAPLFKLALTVGVIVAGAALANDLISATPLDLPRVGRHALTGLAVGTFASSLLGLIAIVGFLLIGRRKD